MEIAHRARCVDFHQWTRVIPVAETKSLVLWVAADHGDEREEDQPNSQHNLTYGQVELWLTEPSHGKDVKHGVDEDLDAKRDCGRVIVSPIVDHTVNRCDFEGDVDGNHEEVVPGDSGLVRLVHTTASHGYEWRLDRQEADELTTTSGDTEDDTSPDHKGKQQTKRPAVEQASGDGDKERGTNRATNGNHVQGSRVESPLRGVDVWACKRWSCWAHLDIRADAR